MKDLANPFYDYRIQQERQPFDFSPFTSRELRSALESCKATAPGHDGILNTVFSHLQEEVLMLLLDFFNRLWRGGVVPASWCVAIIIPIPKPGKEHSVVTMFFTNVFDIMSL